MSAGNKQPAVSKPMIVILVIAVLILIWSLIPTDKQTAPVVERPTKSNNMVASEKNSKPEQSVEEQIETLAIVKPEANRNPFKVPAIVRLRSSLDSKFNQSPSIAVEGTSPGESRTDNSKPVWKGTMGTADDQLVIVTYKSRTYFLRLGDKLGSSGYRLTGFSAGKIVLSSAKGELRLEREAKKK